MKELKILLVEDDEVDVMNVQRALNKSNVKHSMEIAGNGLDALKMLRAEGSDLFNPSVILLDLNMPKMNGIEFLTEIRKDDKLKSLPVFAFTTSNEDSDKIEAYNLNVSGYIIKPVEPDSFKKTMIALLEYWKIIEFPEK